MKDTRRTRLWALAGAFALALTAGVVARRRAMKDTTPVLSAGEELRDAVASPMPPATAALAGRPVPTSWFKTPDQHRAEMETALLSSRRRRALARNVSLQ